MEQKKRILVVDDTEINRVILDDILSPEYDISEASSGLEAVAYLKQHSAEVSLVLLDIVMPEMDGFEVLAMMNRNNWLPSIPVIMISAEVSSTYVDHAYDLGATDYITRPFDEKTVRRRVQNTIMLYTKQKNLENMVAEQIMEKERSNSEMVEILSNIVEFRNGESGLHVLHVRMITDTLLQNLMVKAPQYELTSSKIALISNASAMHDIGKISVDEKILNKPGKLTPEEYEIMKTHAAMGAQMLEEAAPQSGDSDLIRVARDICRWHHERYDGRGYPDGLKGEEIPIAAQVVALADVYDALTSKRVYKPPFTHEKAIEMILNGECGTFNPLLLECLQECSSQLSRDLDVRSPKAISTVESRRIATELMARGDLHISNQTLTLLEQERSKYEFYSIRTDDILFEYDSDAKLLEFSENGAARLGVERSVSRPKEDPTVQSWGTDGLMKVRTLVRGATPHAPDGETECTLLLGGQPRPAKIAIRTLWDSEEASAYSRIFGMILLPEE